MVRGVPTDQENEAMREFMEDDDASSYVKLAEYSRVLKSREEWRAFAYYELGAIAILVFAGWVI